MEEIKTIIALSEIRGTLDYGIPKVITNLWNNIYVKNITEAQNDIATLHKLLDQIELTATELIQKESQEEGLCKEEDVDENPSANESHQKQNHKKAFQYQHYVGVVPKLRQEAVVGVEALYLQQVGKQHRL